MKRLFLFLLVLALVVPAVSVAGTSRVLPSAYNEHTFGGASRDYTDLATWESDTDNDLVTAASGAVLTCYADATSYNDGVTLSGSTSSSSYFRVIRAAPGHRGTPTSGVRFVKSDSVSYIIFDAAEPYNAIYDIAASGQQTSSTSGRYVGCFLNENNEGARFVGCTVFSTSATGTSTSGAYGFRLAYRTAVVANCVAKDVVGRAVASGGFSNITGTGGDANQKMYIYNCTATGCSTGLMLYSNISGLSLTVYAKNCVLQDNDVNKTSLGFQPKNLNQTTNCIDGGVVFGADGYHLGKTDSAGKNHGTDLSNDSVFPFNDDIDGRIRKGAWDIGCDEISAQHLPIVQ